MRLSGFKKRDKDTEKDSHDMKICSVNHWENRDEYDENKILSHTKKLKKIKVIKSRKMMCSVCCFIVTSYLLISVLE